MTFASLIKTGWKYKRSLICGVIAGTIIYGFCTFVYWFWTYPRSGEHGFLPVAEPGDVICPTQAAFHNYYNNHGGQWLMFIDKSYSFSSEDWQKAHTILHRAAQENNCLYLTPGTMLSSKGNATGDTIGLTTYDGRYIDADGKVHGKVQLVSESLKTVTAQMPDGSTFEGYAWDNTEKATDN